MVDVHQVAPHLYQVIPPVEYSEDYYDDESAIEYIVVSGTGTYIFPANKEGVILSYSGLPGSFRGDINHAKAIEGFIEHFNA